ncbi:MAG: thioredoxin domain-containing protein [Patescibacteria group bacterium]
MPEEHFFTAHTSARLTFIVGIVIGMVIMTATGFGFFAYVFSGGEITSYAIAPLDTESQILTEPITQVIEQTSTDISGADNQIFGAKENYTITLVQYVDYECRFCKKFFPDVVALTNDHSDSVRLIIKQYPLVQIHPRAKAASSAATCAAAQNKLLEYSTALYEHQADLSSDVLLSLAKDQQLDESQFKTCLTSSATLKQLESDAQEAKILGIKTQPNLLIINNNGDKQLIDGYVNKDYLVGVLGL